MQLNYIIAARCVPPGSPTAWSPRCSVRIAGTDASAEIRAEAEARASSPVQAAARAGFRNGVHKRRVINESSL